MECCSSSQPLPLPQPVPLPLWIVQVMLVELKTTIWAAIEWLKELLSLGGQVPSERNVWNATHKIKLKLKLHQLCTTHTHTHTLACLSICFSLSRSLPLSLLLSLSLSVFAENVHTKLFMTHLACQHFGCCLVALLVTLQPPLPTDDSLHRSRVSSLPTGIVFQHFQIERTATTTTSRDWRRENSAQIEQIVFYSKFVFAFCIYWCANRAKRWLNLSQIVVCPSKIN